MPRSKEPDDHLVCGQAAPLTPPDVDPGEPSCAHWKWGAKKVRLSLKRTGQPGWVISPLGALNFLNCKMRTVLLIQPTPCNGVVTGAADEDLEAPIETACML